MQQWLLNKSNSSPVLQSIIPVFTVLDLQHTLTVCEVGGDFSPSIIWKRNLPIFPPVGTVHSHLLMQWKVPRKYKFPEFFLLVPQAAYWVAGSQSATAWQVTDIKELKDPEVVLRKWCGSFLWRFCQIFLWLHKQESLFVSVLYLCLELWAWWLVGGLIGKALHAWVPSNFPPSADAQ